MTWCVQVNVRTGRAAFVPARPEWPKTFAEVQLMLELIRETYSGSTYDVIISHTPTPTR